MTHIYKDDQLLANIPFEAVAEWLKDQSINPEDVRIEMSDAETRQVIRGRIHEEVADPESLLGTTADGTGLLMALALADVVALSGASNFSAYKKAKLETLNALAGEVDLAALARAALGQIQSGEVILTASLKGLEGAITESLTRSTGVAKILTQAFGAPTQT